MRKLHLCLLVIMCMLTSCSSPYIGRTVNVSAPAVCQIDMLPATCSWSTEDFVLDYEILEKGAHIYEIKGTAKKIGGTSGTFTDYSRASFTLLIIHNGVIVESIKIAGGSGSFDRGITFKREFSTENTFEATILIYEMQVMG